MMSRRLRTVLVGLDGSACSHAAVELGIRWVSQSGGLLVGIGIVDEPGITRPVAVPLGASYYKERRDDRRVSDARSQVEQFLEQFALRCAEANVPSKLLEVTGPPETEILLEAQRYDLVLLGTETWFHFETSDWPNGTLARVLKNCPRPVVAAPVELGAGSSVLIAYDGSLQSARALQAFWACGVEMNLPVHIVSIATDHVQAAKSVQRAAEFLSFHGIEAARHPIATRHSPAEVILEQESALDAALLVMGAYGQPSLKEFFIGSVTRTVIRETRKPLFLYH